MTPTKRLKFLDLKFDALLLPEVTRRLNRVTSQTPYGYVVTPNVDHVVRLQSQLELKPLYEQADLCLCDSRVLRRLAAFDRIKLPVVPGSDLTDALFEGVIRAGDRIAVVGGNPRLLDQLRTKFEGIEFVQHVPPLGLREDADARRRAAEFIASAHARFSFVAVGSPQQEMIASEVKRQTGATGVALCIGAALDFIAGDQKRAPAVFRRLGVEWAYRLGSDPKRLWRRYLVDGMRIFPIYLRWSKSGRYRAAAVLALLLAAATAILLYVTRSFEPNTGESVVAKREAGSRKGEFVFQLPPPDLLRPLSPVEAAEENAGRPFATRTDVPPTSFVLSAPPESRLRAVTCLAQAAYYEAASEGLDGGRAVVQVVLNRTRHPAYPASICGVVYQGSERRTGCQFSFTCDGSLLRTPNAGLWKRAMTIAQEAIAGRVFGPVGHATHYHADYVLPYWADSLDKMVQIGRHIFYRFPGAYGDKRSFRQRYSGLEPERPQQLPKEVIPLSSESEQLAETLINTEPVVEKPGPVEIAPLPTSPLAIDAVRGELIADEAGVTATSVRRPASPACSEGSDSNRLRPLGADDMRAGVRSTDC